MLSQKVVSSRTDRVAKALNKILKTVTIGTEPSLIKFVEPLTAAKIKELKPFLAIGKGGQTNYLSHKNVERLKDLHKLLKNDMKPVRLTDPKIIKFMSNQP